MARRYAEGTSVAPETTQGEIVKLLKEYGARDYMTGWEGNAAVVMFRMKNKAIRFEVPMPAPGEKQFVKRTPQATRRAWEERVRQRWRVLLFTLKAKLVSMDEGIEPFEEIFLANFQTAAGRTIGGLLLPHLNGVINGTLLQALPPPQEPVHAP